MWILQSIEPEDARLTFRMLPNTLKTMGRASGADFVVDAALVSRVHCRLTLNAEGGRLEIEDLGSTNGTFVNGRKVGKSGKTILKDGDKLTVGRVQFMVSSTTNPDSGSPKTTWTS
jgi:pSer/pThr/pTyr-binding forkhead associated (FHA) protein